MLYSSGKLGTPEMVSVYYMYFIRVNPAKALFPLTVCGGVCVYGRVKIRMESVPILAGASPLKSMVSKFSVNAPVPVNANSRSVGTGPKPRFVLCVA